MTDESMKDVTPAPQSAIQDWFGAWKASLQDVLSQISGKPNAFELSTQIIASSDNDLWYLVVAGGALHGEMTLCVPADSGLQLARKFLGELETAATETSAVPEPLSAENKEAVEELLRQVAGIAATALGAKAKGEVQLNLSASVAPTWSSGAVACLQTLADPGKPITIEIRISPALSAELQMQMQIQTNKTIGQTSAASSAPTELPPGAPSNYRRLMDVGLDVKLRFGTRRMLLRDVLALSAGVVVELENSVHSPVDLLLDGRLIAQGEVVIVDGKYGLRVGEVVDPAPVSGLSTGAE